VEQAEPQLCGLAGAYTESRADSSATLPEAAHCAGVSPRFFGVLGTTSLLGRGFNTDEESRADAGGCDQASGSGGRRFQRDPKVVAGSAVQWAVGFRSSVLSPPTVTFPTSASTYGSVAVRTPRCGERATRDFYETVARLRDSVSERLRRPTSPRSRAQLAIEFPKTDAGWSPLVKPLKEQNGSGCAARLVDLVGAVSLVLLILART